MGTDMGMGMVMVMVTVSNCHDSGRDNCQDRARVRGIVTICGKVSLRFEFSVRIRAFDPYVSFPLALTLTLTRILILIAHIVTISPAIRNNTLSFVGPIMCGLYAVIIMRGLYVGLIARLLVAVLEPIRL